MNQKLLYAFWDKRDFQSENEEYIRRLKQEKHECLEALQKGRESLEKGTTRLNSNNIRLERGELSENARKRMQGKNAIIRELIEKANTEIPKLVGKINDLDNKIAEAKGQMQPQHLEQVTSYFPSAG